MCPRSIRKAIARNVSKEHVGESVVQVQLGGEGGLSDSGRVLTRRPFCRAGPETGHKQCAQRSFWNLAALFVCLDAHVVIGSSQPANMANPGRQQRKKSRGARGEPGPVPDKGPYRVFEISEVPMQVPLLRRVNGDLREIGHWRMKLPCESLSFRTPQKPKRNQD